MGAACGALAVASLPVGSRGKWLVLGCIAFPFSLLCFSWSRWLPISMALLLLVGASQLAQQVLTNSLLQLAASSEFHGRVVSFFALWNNGLTRLGSVPVGALSQYGSVPLALLGGASLSIVWVLLAVRRMPFIWRLP